MEKEYRIKKDMYNEFKDRYEKYTGKVLYVIHLDFDYYTLKESNIKKSDQKELYKLGKKYKVIAGSEETHNLGFGWFFHIGEIIECIKEYCGRGVSEFGNEAKFSSTSRNKKQIMPISLLHQVITPID